MSLHPGFFGQQHSKRSSESTSGLGQGRSFRRADDGVVMTYAVNGKEDIVTQSEILDLCRAHIELGLTTNQVGAISVGDEPNHELLAREVRTIMAARPILADACNRILAALEAPVPKRQ